MCKCLTCENSLKRPQLLLWWHLLFQCQSVHNRIICLDIARIQESYYEYSNSSGMNRLLSAKGSECICVNTELSIRAVF